MGGECDSCKLKRTGLQRAAVNQSTPDIATPGSPEVIGSRLGQDFSRVRALSTNAPQQIQASSISHHPGNKYEQEAEWFARYIPATAAPQLGDSPGADRGLLQPPRVGQTSSTPFQSLGHGAPLGPQERSFFEPRFQHDFSHVRVHIGENAAAQANAFHAHAFTYGQHIVFNDGMFSPSTPQGRQLLAHELTHVVQQAPQTTHTPQLAEQSAAHTVQQSTQSPVIARVDASMCSSDCLAPDGTGPATGKFSLTIYADKEGSFLLIPFTHGVGHSWLRLEDDTGRFWTFGFWPKTGFDPNNSTADVEGCVHHPDTAHKPTASQKFDLTPAQFADAFSSATSSCTTQPKYNLFGLQCTEFVKRVMAAAGLAPFGGFGLIWESPNALDTWLRTNSLVLGISGTAASSGPGGAGSVGLDITYRHQFYSLLGQRLRLYGLGRAEVSGPVKSLSTGAGLELNPKRIYLPAPYIEGGGALGDLSGQPGPARFGAGLTGSAGLRFNIDEFAVVGIEYNVVKDLVNSDPTLHRLMITAGIRLF
jgi:hypothetical protein